MYQLMNPGMQPNALWDQLEQQRRAGHVLFTRMSPHSVESGLDRDLAKIATVFTDVFLPAGTGLAANRCGSPTSATPGFGSTAPACGD